MEPSLSSTSLTNSSGSPTRALANGAEGVTKFFMTAPFITVGWRWQAWRIHPIIPVTVDLPLVPPTATLRCVQEPGEELRPSQVRQAQLAGADHVGNIVFDRGRSDEGHPRPKPGPI